MEALVYCSINKYGIELKELNTASNRILFYGMLEERKKEVLK